MDSGLLPVGLKVRWRSVGDRMCTHLRSQEGWVGAAAEAVEVAVEVEVEVEAGWVGDRGPQQQGQSKRRRGSAGASVLSVV